MLTMQRFIIDNNKYIWSGLGFLSMMMLRNYFNGPRTKLHKNLKDNVVIVTGASDGIGKETALQLLKDDAIVIFACRDEQKTNQMISSIKNEEVRKRAIFIKLDLSDYESIKKFIAEFKSKYNKLNILVNNAGAIYNTFQKSKCGIESTLQVNTFGPMILTQGLIDLIHKSNGRVINVTGKLYESINYDLKYYQDILKKPEEFNFNEKSYGGVNQYSWSKIGNIYFTQYLNQYALDNKLNIKTAVLHPGVIHTAIGRDYNSIFYTLVKLMISPLYWFMTKTLNMGAQTTLHLCYLSDDAFKSGEYYSDCKQVGLNKLALDQNTRDAFIKFSRTFINLHAEKDDVKFVL